MKEADATAHNAHRRGTATTSRIMGRKAMRLEQVATIR